MKILDEMVIKDKYDVVVVGAGIGGITAAALLANKGLDVLVIEQHYLPGGVCSTVKRHDVCMDAGAALLFGWARDTEGGGNNPHVFVMNELEEEIDIIPHEALYRMHFTGNRSVTFWKDFNMYLKELSVAFPGKVEQFKGFYNEAFKIYKMMTLTPMPMSPDTVPKELGLKMLLKHPITTMKMPKLMNGSLKDVLYKYVKDREVEGLFDLLIASCYCTSIAETPLMLAAAVVCNTHIDGAFYPAGSPQMLPNKIEKAFEKKGGQILYRHMVEEILMKDNSAYGVRLDNGLEIRADKVISNSTIWNLYGKLIKPEYIAPERMKWAHNFVPTVGAVIVYITVKKEAIPPDTHSIEAFIGDLTVLEKNNYFMYIPSIDDPSICPEDMHSVSILCSAGDYKWPRPWEPEYKSDKYIKEKNLIAEKALSAIEKRFPKFRENIVTMDIASPSTTERFTLKNYGNIGGPKQTLGQHLLNRLPARSEFKNLYCVGDSTPMGEGVVSATASAVGAANMILEDLKKPIYLPRNHPKYYVNYVKGKKREPLPSLDKPITEKEAKRLAVECQWCEDPKCMKNCPAGIDVLNFVRRIEAGNFIGAARMIREKNPLGAICGFLCPSEKLCEKECNRLKFSNRPTNIKLLQQWVCNQAMDDGWATNLAPLNGKSIAVIGAGPSGLSTAYFLARLGYKIDIFEQTSKIGGTIDQYIPHHRITEKVVRAEFDKLLIPERITVHFNHSLGKNLTLKDLQTQYNAIYLSMGFNASRQLAIPGACSERVIDALTFLKKNKTNEITSIVGKYVVIGGGSVAVDAAMTARKLGASEVIMICLESSEEMPCLACEKQEMACEEIKVWNSWSPLEIIPGEKLKVKLVACTSVFDKDGKFSPILDRSREKAIECDYVITAIGQQIAPDLSKYLKETLGQGIINGKLKINPDSHQIEGYPNLYAGGDLIRGAGTIVAAVADGRKAAISINKQINQ
jgi:phytoene dehydrogenase-like protein